MPADLIPSSAEYLRFLPEILLSVFGIAIMMLEAVSHGKRTYLGVIALVGLTAAFIANTPLVSMPGPAFHDMIVVDGYGSFFRGVVLVVGFLCILTSFSYLEREGAQTGEYYALILDRGAMHSGNRVRFDHGFHRAGDLVDCHLHFGWFSPRRPA